MEAVREGIRSCDEDYRFFSPPPELGYSLKPAQGVTSERMQGRDH
jgi:hypothetical protein